MPHLNRRAACRGLAAALAAPAIPGRARAGTDIGPALAGIEARIGGRLGVAVGGEGGSLLLGHRADERFPMCSTFKVLLAAMALARVDAGADTLDRPLTFGEANLLDYAPVARKVFSASGGAGRMSLAEACDAAIVWSDNTAANLLLAALGGPAALTAWLRGAGDPLTRLDRTEPS